MKLITFSLYGHKSKYVLGLYENLALAPSIYPGWNIRVYLDKDHYAIHKIRREHPTVQIVERTSVPGSRGMFWRLEALYDINYSHVIVRDSDSRLHEREANLTNEWIASGKEIHAIRDHPAHNNIPLLGVHSV